MSRLDAINPTTDHYCTTCYEVVRLGQSSSHREEVHDGELEPDIVPIHSAGGGEFVAQSDKMGHFSPHMWTQIDDHEVCAECGGVKVQPEDVPDDLIEERDGGNTRTEGADTDR
jgi:hypothetical protein